MEKWETKASLELAIEPSAGRLEGELNIIFCMAVYRRLENVFSFILR
jgi:hypothetical protein